MLKGRMLLAPSALAWIVLACSGAEPGEGLSGPSLKAPGTLRATIGGFGCGVSYDAIVQTDETELVAYGVEAVTDTAHICEQWTGNDYNAEVTQTGSSEPASDYAEDVGTVIYQAGTASVYNKSGGQMEAPSGVGASSFEFVAATQEEQQASYNEPYYAVIQDPDPVHCSNPPCADMDVKVGVPGINVPPTGRGDVTTAVASPLRRGVLKSLLKGMTELMPSTDGFRRFRGVSPRGEELTISIDPITELIRRQEVKTANSTVRADLTWSLRNGKFVRDQMDVVGEDVVNGRRISSKTTILLRNVNWDPAAVK
jgi:hypothetical protein